MKNRERGAKMGQGEQKTFTTLWKLLTLGDCVQKSFCGVGSTCAT